MFHYFFSSCYLAFEWTDLGGSNLCFQFKTSKYPGPILITFFPNSLFFKDFAFLLNKSSAPTLHQVYYS